MSASSCSDASCWTPLEHFSWTLYYEAMTPISSQKIKQRCRSREIAETILISTVLTCSLFAKATNGSRDNTHLSIVHVKSVHGHTSKSGPRGNFSSCILALRNTPAQSFSEEAITKSLSNCASTQFCFDHRVGYSECPLCHVFHYEVEESHVHIGQFCAPSPDVMDTLTQPNNVTTTRNCFDVMFDDDSFLDTRHNPRNHAHIMRGTVLMSSAVYSSLGICACRIRRGTGDKYAKELWMQSSGKCGYIAHALPVPTFPHATKLSAFGSRNRPNHAQLAFAMLHASTFRAASTVYLPSGRCSLTTMLLTTRSGSRTIRNRNEVMSVLSLYASKHGLDFEVFDPATSDLSGQARRYHKAKLVIGMHGASEMNLAFMQPGSILVTVFPSNFRYLIHRSFALSRGIKYISLSKFSKTSCEYCREGGKMRTVGRKVSSNELTSALDLLEKSGYLSSCSD